MPPFVKAINNVIAASLLALAVWEFWQIFAHHLSPWNVWAPCIGALASLGLWRRVAWGRFLFSCASIWLTFYLTIFLIPGRDRRINGSSVFEQLFGAMPPLWLSWMLIVLVAFVVLVPAVTIGWQKSWFRSRLW